MENLSMWMARNLRPHYDYTIKDFDPISGTCGFNMTLVPFKDDMEMPESGELNFAYMSGRTISYGELVPVTRRAITELLKEGKIHGVQMSDLTGKKVDAIADLTDRCTDGTYEETTEIVNRVLDILTSAKPRRAKADNDVDAVAFAKERLGLKWGVVAKPAGYTVIISPFGNFTNDDIRKMYVFEGKKYGFQELGSMMLSMIYSYMLHEVPVIAGEYGIALMKMQEVEKCLPALFAAQAELNEKAKMVTECLRREHDFAERIANAIRNPGDLEQIDKELSEKIEKFVGERYTVTLDEYIETNFKPAWYYVGNLVGPSTVPLGFGMFKRPDESTKIVGIVGRMGSYTLDEIEQAAATAFFEVVSRYDNIMDEYNKIFKEFKYSVVTDEIVHSMVDKMNQLTDNLDSAVRDAIICRIEHVKLETFPDVAAKFFSGFANA